MARSRILNLWGHMSWSLVMISSLLVMVMTTTSAPGVAATGKVVGSLAVDGDAIAITSGAAYSEHGMVVILLANEKIPDGRARAFTDRYLRGTGLKGLAVMLKPADDGTGVPELVYAKYFRGDGMATFDTRPASHFFVDVLELSTKKAAGRFSGVVVDSPVQVTLDVSFDLDVEEPPAPEPLPAGGGDPGKAYKNLVKAVSSKDVQAVKTHCSARLRQMMADDPGSAGEFVDYLAETYTGEKVTVVGGTYDVDRAELMVEVVNGGESRSETVRMELEDGGW